MNQKVKQLSEHFDNLKSVNTLESEPEICKDKEDNQADLEEGQHCQGGSLRDQRFRPATQNNRK